MTVDATEFVPGDTTPAPTPAATSCELTVTTRLVPPSVIDSPGPTLVGAGAALIDSGKVDQVDVTGLKHAADCTIVAAEAGAAVGTDQSSAELIRLAAENAR